MLRMIKKLVYLILTLLWNMYVSESLDFTLGMLSPFRHPRLGWENNAAAATIAIEKAQSEGILSNHNISVVWRDDKCKALGGTESTYILHETFDVDVFIGPPCSGSTTPSGLLASVWNLPMFSQASSDPSLADKTVYKTLVRLGPPFNKMGKALVETFKYFNWDSVVIVSKRKTDNRNVFCDYSSRSIESEFLQSNITIADWIIINPAITDKAINDVLTRVRQRGRIVILCTEIADDRRRLLLRARELGMTDGSYVYFLPDHLPPSNVGMPWVKGDGQDDNAKQAFTSAFQITVAEMAGPEVESFRDLVSVKMAEPPWNYNYTMTAGIRGSEYSAFLHDVVYLYLLVLNETLAYGENHRNGTAMFKHAQGKAFRGITGNVKVDSNGDREPDYWMWDLSPSGSAFEVAIEARLTSKDSRSIDWGTENGNPPPAEPICGFSNENCQARHDNNDHVFIISCVLAGVITVTIAAVGFVIYRRARLEKELQQQLWRINYEDINFTKARLIGSISTINLNTNSQLTTSSGAGENQVFSLIGYFKGNIVAIKKLKVFQISLTRADQLQLKAMRDLHHENINAFIGICLDERSPCILTNYCQKGSLQDIIENDDISLDWMFKMSLITDLLNAMHFIHGSSLLCHGNLKSSNCLVDNRWVLKITDYGIQKLRQAQRNDDPSDYQRNAGLFWRAPEFLRSNELYNLSSQKGDVFSFAVILFEILYRRQPYDTSILTPTDIISRVRMLETPPFRPTKMLEPGEKMNGIDIPSNSVDILERCWDEIPEFRPTFSNIKTDISKWQSGKKLNIVDNMVLMLEKYANNLEEIVEHRTAELFEEKKKTDMLLYRMMPESVAERLKTGEGVTPEIFESVTIYFSDIVGFTSLASASTPIEIVDFLNDLYTKFDSVIAMHDVYKVETIGDAYMVVSGLPVRNEGRHAGEIANMSLDLLDEVHRFKIKHKPGLQLKLRIGVHTGPCAAGVVGKTMPRYCLFGDTVNMASRMESCGEALKIHLSEAAADALRSTCTYSIEVRGEMEIKGKGNQTTYWLLDKAPVNTNKDTDLGIVLEEPVSNRDPRRPSRHNVFSAVPADISI